VGDSLKCFQPFHNGITNAAQAAITAMMAPTSKYSVATNQIRPTVMSNL